MHNQDTVIGDGEARELMHKPGGSPKVELKMRAIRGVAKDKEEVGI